MRDLGGGGRRLPAAPRTSVEEAFAQLLYEAAQAGNEAGGFVNGYGGVTSGFEGDDRGRPGQAFFEPDAPVPVGAESRQHDVIPHAPRGPREMVPFLPRFTVGRHSVPGVAFHALNGLLGAPSVALEGAQDALYRAYPGLNHDITPETFDEVDREFRRTVPGYEPGHRFGGQRRR